MTGVDPAHSMPPHFLQQLFALTPTEATLARWLMTGRSINEYADERGVSIQTARTQLKAVLSKTGMRRQAELVAYLARLPRY